MTFVWEQRKLENTVQITMGQSPDGSTYSDVPSNYILIQGNADLQNGWVVPRIWTSKMTKKADAGDLIMSVRAPAGAMGKTAYNAVIGRGVAAIKGNEFIYQLLVKMDSDGYWRSLSCGSTFESLNSENIKNAEVSIPSIAEQTKIGQYFSRLDQFITLHQWKCTIYEKIKVNVWEQRKLENITFPAGKKNKNNLPYESYSVTNESGFIPQNEQFENGGTLATADKSMYYIVSQNSFAYNPARINIGSIGYYDKPKNVIVSSLYEVFKTTDDIDDRFLWHWFKGEDFQKMIERYQEGGVRLYFYYDKLCMCRLLVPSIQEQRKIGKQLDTLDRLITLHQWECTIYEIIVVNDEKQRKSLEKLIILENNVFLIVNLSFEQGGIDKFYSKKFLLRFNEVIEIKVELLFIIVNNSRNVIDDVEEEIVILCKVCFNIIIYRDITFVVYYDQILLHIQEIKFTFILRMLFINIIYLNLTTKNVSTLVYFFIFDYIFILYY